MLLAGGLGNIPEIDRVGFINAYEKGDKQEAYKILDRDSFKQNMALESDQPIIAKQTKAEKGI